MASDVDLLRRLVAAPTVSGRPNRAVVAELAGYLAADGVRLYEDTAADGDRANLVAWCGPPCSAEREGLTLSGHLDVVPAEAGRWSSPPFELTEGDGRLAGRGTVDMKGFVALGVNTFRAAASRGVGPVALLLTYDEEVGTVGARELVERDALPEPLPRATVVGEPTRMRAVRAHKGHVKLRLEVDGVSAHSGYPQLGRNAIVPAARAVGELAALGEELAAMRPASAAHFPDAPGPALNIGVIRGGSAVNVVPDHCAVDVGLRTLPGMDAALVVDRLRAAVAAAVGEVDHRFLELGESPPLLLDAGAEVYGAACAALGQPRDQEHAVAYATDAGWLQRMGLECVVCGPGDIARAHKPDEHILPDELAAGRRFLDAMVARMCRRS